MSSAQAQVKIDDAWVRATVPQQKATGAFVRLTSVKPTRLVEVLSPAAGVIEIHKMDMVDNIMKMRKIDGIDLPAGQNVELKPGGFHIMLLDLKSQVRAGDKIALTFVFEDQNKKRENMAIFAEAKSLNSNATSAMSH
ncbi:copper chaperone PCu(A)C [Undibacterium sp. 5I1]|uniref:copper chaperone PCu(A)C n=1 Tax=unclassified Undibacterium TaxID=2630295 RepID=UPI002AB3BCB1|nr:MULTISPECIES: copper chaperone PCu(A)C [unclassified Undibacterium]MDY7540013.1 copper chaperone PCu(A)C [Undibacterium sp. 5I1]MEB0257860.1 copper chaperone PCu(A)C [Undibacterium sp. 5I1]